MRYKAQMLPTRSCGVVYVAFLLTAGSLCAQSGVFTVQVGAPAPPPTPLVRFNDTWHLHKGTNAPVSGWQTNADATLDNTWVARGGGFGFATDNPNETIKCQTVLNDMFNFYDTVYIR